MPVLPAGRDAIDDSYVVYLSRHLLPFQPPLLLRVSIPSSFAQFLLVVSAAMY